MTKSRFKYEKWYKSCNFIKEEMQFYCFEDFIEQAVKIRRKYLDSDPLTVQLYQWYVYASPLSYERKCAIWEFLNMRMPLNTLKKK